MSEKEKSLAQCLHSIIAPILDSYKENLKSNSPSKSTCREFLSNVVEVSKEPTIHSNKNIAVSTESSNSGNIRHASRNTNNKDIKKVFVLGDRSLIFHVRTNDVSSNKKAKSIEESVVSLVKEVKASKRDVSISSIILGNDNWNNKVI